MYYGQREQLEYDFVVGPGASPKAITLAMTYTGDKPLRINEAGDLVASLDEGQVYFHRRWFTSRAVRRGPTWMGGTC